MISAIVATITFIGAAQSSPDLQNPFHTYYYDARGVDLTPWLEDKARSVERSFGAAIKGEVEHSHGHTAMLVTVSRSGRIADVRVAFSSARPTIDKACHDALWWPTRPLPSDFPDNWVPLIWICWYNENPYDLFDGASYKRVWEQYRKLILGEMGTGPGSDLHAEPPAVALHRAVVEGDMDSLQKLLAQGVDVDGPAPGGLTPLIQASATGQLMIVKTLLDAGADVNAETVDGHTALVHAASAAHRDIAQTLLQSGAKANVSTEAHVTPLLAGIVAGDLGTPSRPS